MYVRIVRIWYTPRVCARYAAVIVVIASANYPCSHASRGYYLGAAKLVTADLGSLLSTHLLLALRGEGRLQYSASAAVSTTSKQLNFRSTFHRVLQLSNVLHYNYTNAWQVNILLKITSE